MQKRQQLQYEHDLKNHFDILSRSRTDRLKHYGLHFAKYAGRLARGEREKKSRQETLVDAFLVSLSAANALNQALPDSRAMGGSPPDNLQFTDCAGRFADACEKIDHLEEFREIAMQANADIMAWIMSFAASHNLDMDKLACERRKQLASRAVYAAG
jgi:hypothetical protein